MKLIHTAAAGLLLCAGLVSCELKEELSGTSSSSEIGYLDLSVAVNASQNVITKASSDDVSDDGTSSGSSVSADDFPVVITGVTDETYEKSFDSYAALVDESPIELPVGEYTVTAHSNLTLETQMTEPYYEGETESNLTITKDVTSSASVTCTMKNMRLQLSYSSDFTANFTEWTITITDDSSIVVFTDEEGTNPDPIYWLVADDVDEITIEISATNSYGDTLSDTRVLTKPSGSSSDYWTGGDALNITMDAIDSSEVEAGVSGITVTADVTFEDSEESVEVPVTVTTTTEDDDDDNNNNNGNGTTTGALSMTLPNNGSITFSIGNAPTSADVVINAEDGIKSLKVNISSSNAGFNLALSDLAEMGLDFTSSGVEIVANEIINEVLTLIAGSDIDVPTLSEKDTTYTFPIASFFALMERYGTGTFTFSISLEDMNGNTLDDSLTVTITD